LQPGSVAASHGNIDAIGDPDFAPNQHRHADASGNCHRDLHGDQYADGDGDRD
jgi:hypothetical protein